MYVFTRKKFRPDGTPRRGVQKNERKKNNKKTKPNSVAHGDLARTTVCPSLDRIFGSRNVRVTGILVTVVPYGSHVPTMTDVYALYVLVYDVWSGPVTIRFAPDEYSERKPKSNTTLACTVIFSQSSDRRYRSVPAATENETKKITEILNSQISPESPDKAYDFVFKP